MVDLLELGKKRVEVLKKAIIIAEKQQNSFPEGRLRVSPSPSQIRYFQVVADGDPQGTYIPHGKIQLAAALAQKKYNQKFLQEAKAELSAWNQCITRITKKNADQVYDDLSEERKALVMPYIIPDEIYAQQWQNKEYKTSNYMNESKIYDTRRGEKVRSKSEAILADMFFELGIPYHYERPLSLRYSRIRYPDFTLLKVRTREEIYLEHFGLLDDEDYRVSCIHKLDEYRENGIYLGKNLLITYESNSSPLDIKGTRKMMKEIFFG